MNKRYYVNSIFLTQLQLLLLCLFVNKPLVYSVTIIYLLLIQEQKYVVNK